MGPPTGTVTFLFTDIEGSTRLWDERPEAMRVALARHDDLLREAIEGTGGYVFAPAGDGLAAAFQRSADGVAAAVDAQRALAAEPWPDGLAISVRMGLHTGEAEERDGSYFGSPVNRAARLMAAAPGGQVVVSAATAAVLDPAAGIGLVDLGLVPLRGLAEPTRVFGVKADGLDWLDRPLATADVMRGNLPRPTTEWFGPMAELNRRVAELGRRRLVTLTGPGGVGKTRLAVEIGTLTAGDFPDGVWLVELGPVADPDAVPSVVAAALGVLTQEGSDTLGAIVDWLEERRLLLIVDNCEHVRVPASSVIEAALRGRNAVTVLTTSREPLGVSGERVVPVPSLSPTDAVDLFCDRANAADASLGFGDAERDIIDAICTRLDGIPLAIELAAARMRSLTPADLLDRLVDRFKVLRGGSRNAVERHQTLRATVAWSYQLLSEPERALFDRLSVFAGGFDLAAAEAVCRGAAVDPDDVDDLLAGLVDKSLVVADRGDRAARYRLLETLRQYGEERLDDRGETLATRERHLDHYLSVAERYAVVWNSPRAVEAVRAFRNEWDNMRAAQATAVDLSDPVRAERLLVATYLPAASGMRAEYLEWADRTVELAAPDHPNPNAYGLAAIVAWLIGDNERAIALAQQGIAVAAHPDHPDTLQCWGFPSNAYLWTGQLEALRDCMAHLEVVLAHEADPVRRWYGDWTLAMIASFFDRATFPRRTAQLSEDADAIGSPEPLSAAAFLEGRVLALQDPPDLDGAMRWYRKSLEHARSFESPGMEATALGWILHGCAALDEREADLLCNQAITSQYELRYWALIWLSLYDTATHLNRSGRTEPAAVVIGHLQAFQSPMLLMGATTRDYDVAAALSGPSVERWKAAGAAMDRNELVRYALRVLDPTSD